jgi:hypothetical protein
LAQITLYLYRISRSLDPSSLSTPNRSLSPPPFGFDINFSDSSLDFLQIESTLLSPQWFTETFYLWSGGNVFGESGKSRWGEVLYKTSVYRKSPFTLEEEKGMKVPIYLIILSFRAHSSLFSLLEFNFNFD